MVAASPPAMFIDPAHRRTTMIRISIHAIAIAASLAALPAAAQYPTRPVTVVVFTPPGGPSDTAARTLAQRVAKSLGQPVVVENRPGADGGIAAQHVLNASPDGHTLLWGSGSMVGIPMLLKTPPFQSLADFAPVSIPVRFAFGLYVHPSVPAANVGELVAHARANPGKLTYATGPLSEFMAAALFLRATGIDMLRVPYKGGAQAMPDVLAGRVHAYFTPMSIGQAHAQAGRLRMLATVQDERSPIAPDVPTLAEAGVRDVSIPSWNAIFAPPRTPREITERLARDIKTALQDPEVRTAYEQRGAQPVGSTPDELAAAITRDIELWKRFIRENRIEPQ